MSCQELTPDSARTLPIRTGFHGTPTPALLPWIVGGLALAALAALSGSIAADVDQMRFFFDENGPIEILQAVCLALTAVIFAVAFLRSSGARALYCVAAFGAIVTATTRETPRCSSAFYDGGMCLTSTGKDWIVVLGAVLCLAALVWRRLNWRKVLHPVALRWVWPSFGVMAMLAGAEVAEHVVWMAMEESLELAAYLYLAAFALWFLYHSRQAPVAREAVPGSLTPPR
ncbi:hypothetical protein [Aureimonas glaciei]|uniref:DUF998 domain-containing protein n=1 Tax=Aureimonas glaciei TaxID=1776957 RepID=A0A917DFK5_9HYPH|nr:hypothetical protein [Aureimonas glaciei]GGD32211.1 hypothetical protein GCM10011335_39100 [Aureimonas glaciei]